MMVTKSRRKNSAVYINSKGFLSSVLSLFLNLPRPQDGASQSVISNRNSDEIEDRDSTLHVLFCDVHVESEHFSDSYRDDARRIIAWVDKERTKFRSRRILLRIFVDIAGGFGDSAKV